MPLDQDRRPLLTNLAPYADSLSKSIAAIGIAVYVCGFLTVSLHHSNYGFIGTNPFRPRILAAGAWFLLFAAIPISAATKYRKHSWMEIAQNFLFFWGFCFGLSWSLAVVFVYEVDTSEGATYVFRSKWWIITLILLATVHFVARAWNRCPRIISAATSVLVVLILAGDEVLRMRHSPYFDTWSVTLWFFCVFSASLIGQKIIRSYVTDPAEWSRVLFVLFFALLMFAQHYYPHIKSSWGGGAPVNATIYLTKDSAFKPNQAICVQMVEESEEGFYIVGVKESRAIYIPRNAVSLVYFSDKVADSALLRDSSIK